mmetsp:Transcript_6570/g.21916  ORF Transcript_6570/g.21916 Transcript_6570/m.21916 type:complete len:374 (+) Transcript_6570:95-1216(+)
MVARGKAAAAAAASTAGAVEWTPLGCGLAELTLSNTLVTGQSFRWAETSPGEFVGVLGRRVVALRQQPSGQVEYQVLLAAAGEQLAPAADSLREYFNLSVSLERLFQEFGAADERFKAVAPYLPGTRMLRQDPTECLFSFICSQNNHVSRIGGMVERLCSEYGTPLGTAAPPSGAAEPRAYYAFPTLEQLSSASDERLRELGFGYRAKYIVGASAALLAKEGGGHEWLLALRTAPYREAAAALCELPGIGPKVAACVCLFALDKHEVVPVDVHVWRMAVTYYSPDLEGKSLTPRVTAAVEDAFVRVFGPYAGWAHLTLFIAALASHRTLLPEALRTPTPSERKRKLKKEKEEGEDAGEESEPKKKVPKAKRAL